MAVKPDRKTESEKDNSTQRYLPFSQIRENIMIMKDSSARIVLRCSTINFLLKSMEEQDAIIISFQRFLNSLDFPIQILVKSSKLDINWYLNKLNNLALNQTNSLLQNQTYEYIEYLRKLVEVAQIMKKEFFVIIPYDEQDNKSVKDTSILSPFKHFWTSVFANWVDIVKIKSQIRDFSNLKRWLSWRINWIKTSLDNIWIRTEEMSKNDLIKFLTDYYNPNLDSYSELRAETSSYNLV